MTACTVSDNRFPGCDFLYFRENWTVSREDVGSIEGFDEGKPTTIQRRLRHIKLESNKPSVTRMNIFLTKQQLNSSKKEKKVPTNIYSRRNVSTNLSPTTNHPPIPPSFSRNRRRKTFREINTRQMLPRAINSWLSLQSSVPWSAWPICGSLHRCSEGVPGFCGPPGVLLKGIWGRIDNYN